MEEHHVLSEVELELVQHAATTALDDDCGSEFLTFVLRVRQRGKAGGGECREDSDGDLDVPRRRPNKRRRGGTRGGKGDSSSRSVGGSCPSYFIEVRRSAMSWDTAGSQLWRAAFLLAEHIRASAHAFIAQIVMELGCGIGLASIVASEFADVVFATDADAAALELAQRNADRNRCGDLRTRILDWDTQLADATVDDSAPERFRWSQDDRDIAQDTSIVIASDVFYDDETTAAFLKALHELMLRSPTLTAVIALERRVVFSAYTLSAISLGFDAFQEHLCTHEASQSSVPNRVTCQQCMAEEGENDDRQPKTHPVKFVARSLSIADIPHAFEYERVSTLMLWQVDAIVVRQATPESLSYRF